MFNKSNDILYSLFRGRKENEKHILATGITPSGLIHIGNMREVLTTDVVIPPLLCTPAIYSKTQALKMM